MEFYSKLTREEIEQRLAETATPLPKFGFSPYHQILYRQKKKGNFALGFITGFTHVGTFHGKLKPQTKGTVIRGKFFHFSSLLPLLMLLVAWIASELLSHFVWHQPFFWQEQHAVMEAVILPATYLILFPLLELYRHYMSLAERLTVVEYIKDTLLE